MSAVVYAHVEIEYTYPASGDDFYQAHCTGCGWHGEERHIDDYLDPDDDFANDVAIADADLHEGFGCTPAHEAGA